MADDRKGNTSHVAKSATDLHICFHCGSKLAYPREYEEVGTRQWHIVLDCPDCPSRREGIFDQPTVERLDDELERGEEAIELALQRRRRIFAGNEPDNLDEELESLREEVELKEIERFASELDDDLIVPSDF